MFNETKLMINVEENEIDITNDEELVDNEAEDESGTDEETGGEESEVEDSENLSGDDGEDPRIQRAEAQKARLTKEINDLKAEKARLKKEKDGEVVTNSEKIDRTYLAANGMTDKDAQNEVLRLSKKFDLDVMDAFEDPDIKSRAEAIVKRKAAQRAIAGGTGGAAKKSKDAAWHAAYYKKNGSFHADATNEHIVKAAEILANS